ncbi:hypothetical protein STAFG_5621 [Streptomyces afghaniensis 772]|uniref:CopC domain-containing protein n=1 Tax=Streptomyces afghaniensis 772 TaxID=1283301 RepID=S4MCT9_9ACTN|nr:copper resistance CopC family protein [Streptomyces afghaniensis]EPJ37328.1 hypothetical protein STAFG_5621 [Streptomyces afghaniensis 772]
MTTTVRRALLLLLLTPLLYVLAGAPQAAFAHTELVSSSPKDGADLAKAPGHLTLTFDEAVDLADVRVLTVGGDRLPVSRAPGGGTDAVRVALPAREHGELAVMWSVVDAEDGHASSGRIALTIGAPAAKTGGEAAASAPAPSPSLRKALVAARWAGYLALALFVGGLAFVVLLWPRGAAEPRSRALLVLAWTVGLPATVASIGLQGPTARSADCGTRCARRRTPICWPPSPGSCSPPALWCGCWQPWCSAPCSRAGPAPPAPRAGGWAPSR